MPASNSESDISDFEFDTPHLLFVQQAIKSVLIGSVFFKTLRLSKQNCSTL